jgi:hypothetical protein
VLQQDGHPRAAQRPWPVGLVGHRGQDAGVEIVGRLERRQVAELRVERLERLELRAAGAAFAHVQEHGQGLPFRERLVEVVLQPVARLPAFRRRGSLHSGLHDRPPGSPTRPSFASMGSRTASLASGFTVSDLFLPDHLIGAGLQHLPDRAGRWIRPDRAEGQVRHRGDVLVGQVLVVPQQDDDLVEGGQVGDDLLQPLHAAVPQPARRPAQRQVHVRRRGRCRPRQEPHAVAAQVVDAVVGGDPEDPVEKA